MQGEISLSGSLFVVGLNWEPWPHDKIEPIELRDRAERLNASTVVVHFERGKSTVGFGSDTSYIGRPSAASAAARNHRGTWLAILQLEDGQFWLIACVNGIPVPGTDTVFESLEIAIERRDELTKRIDFEDVHTFDAEKKTNPLDFKEILIGEQGVVLTSPTRSFRDKLKAVWIRKKKLVLAFAIVSTASVGAYAISTAGDAERQRVTDLKKVELDEQNEISLRALNTEAARQKLTGKWEKMEQPVEKINLCSLKIKRLSSPIAGWKVTKRTCSNTTVSVEWSKSSAGLTTRFKEKARQRQTKDLYPSSGTGILIAPWVSGKFLGSQSLLSSSDARVAISDISIRLSLSSDFKDSKAEGTLKGKKIVATKFQFSNVPDIYQIGRALSTVPGAGIVSMEKMPTNIWEIKGVIFHVS